MTVMIDRFFGLPQSLIRSGVWANMKPSEWSLYVCLMHDSEQYRTRELVRTDAQLCQSTGMSSRALCDARKKMQERGLVVCERTTGNVYLYTICNPDTGQPYPGHPKTPVLYRKKGENEGGTLPRALDDGGASPPASGAVAQFPPRSPASVADEGPSDSLEKHGVPGVFGD